MRPARLLLLAILAAAAACASAPKPAPPVRVLFVGNSVTYSSNMPQMLVAMARHSRVNLQVQQHTPDGGTFGQHDASPVLRALLDAGGWHFVVLQEQSQRPAQEDAWVHANVDGPAKNLARRAKGSSPTARVVLFDTPARRYGDPDYVKTLPALATYGGMQDRVTNTYRRLASELNAEIAPAGEAWRRVRNERPDLELYDDPIHPNREGAYLIACVFYATLLEKTPVGSPIHGGIDSATARYLQQVAWETSRTRFSASFRP